MMISIPVLVPASMPWRSIWSKALFDIAVVGCLSRGLDQFQMFGCRLGCSRYNEIGETSFLYTG